MNILHCFKSLFVFNFSMCSQHDIFPTLLLIRELDRTLKTIEFVIVLLQIFQSLIIADQNNYNISCTMYCDNL